MVTLTPISFLKQKLLFFWRFGGGVWGDGAGQDGGRGQGAGHHVRQDWRQVRAEGLCPRKVRGRGWQDGGHEEERWAFEVDQCLTIFHQITCMNYIYILHHFLLILVILFDTCNYMQIVHSYFLSLNKTSKWVLYF